MSFSYSGIVNHGKITLPSVESWGKNNNILRDPPKSITTKRTDKVFDTSMLNEDIDDSSNRIAESILVYPRGINPMVGISFDNNGSNGGVRSLQQQSLHGSQQTKLPYRVNREGAFRPPILRPVDLYPLSRLPRNNTKIDPVAYTPDFSKKIICQGCPKDYRAVKNNTLVVNTITKKIQNVFKTLPTQVSQKYTQIPLNFETPTNVRYYDNSQHSQKHTENHIRDINNYSVVSNVNRNINTRNINSKLLNKLRAKQLNKLSINSTSKGNTKSVIPDKIILKDKHILKGNIETSNSHQGLSTRNLITNKTSKTNMNMKPVLKGEIIINDSHQGLCTKDMIENRNTNTNILDIKPILRGEISINSSHQGMSNPYIDNERNRKVKLTPKPTFGYMDPKPSMPIVERMNGEVTLQDKGLTLFSKARRLQNKEDM